MDVDVDYDHHYPRRTHVQAFGSWDEGGVQLVHDLPFTQCFESATARQPGALFPLYTTAIYSNEDLYVSGDLYRSDVFTPAMIVVSRPRGRGKGQCKDGHKKKDKNWLECEGVKVAETAPERGRKTGKAVDEDLYKISPELLHAKPKRLQKSKTTAGLLSCCLFPSSCIS